MLINNTAEDLKTLLKEKKLSQGDVAEIMCTSREAINRKINHSSVFYKGFVEIAEVAGYDVEINYIEHGEDE